MGLNTSSDTIDPKVASLYELKEYVEKGVIKKGVKLNKLISINRCNPDRTMNTRATYTEVTVRLASLVENSRWIMKKEKTGYKEE